MAVCGHRKRQCDAGDMPPLPLLGRPVHGITGTFTGTVSGGNWKGWYHFIKKVRSDITGVKTTVAGNHG